MVFKIHHKTYANVVMIVLHYVIKPVLLNYTVILIAVYSCWYYGFVS